jgi:hypothetical protein
MQSGIALSLFNYYLLQICYMKKLITLFTALVITAAAMAQATPQEKKTVKKDLEREKLHRNAVAKNIFTGQPKKAKAAHRAAVAAHKKTRRDVKKIHDNDVRRARARQ